VFAPPDAALLRAECLDAGAAGLASRADDLEQLLLYVGERTPLPVLPRDAIHRAAAAARDEHAHLTRAFAALSEREEQVLQLLMHGWVAKDIARELVVSIATVRSRIRSIFVKLGVRSQVEAVAVAHRIGWTADRRNPPWSTRAFSSDSPSVIS
jgi:DNA-binding NarL/FixJ family response regulator